MASDTANPRLAPQIVSLLASLRRRIFAYVWVQGLALAVAWLGAAFWITLALDWSIEPPAIVRQIFLGCATVGLIYVLYRFILRRSFVRLANANLALLLERRFRKFGDSLVTTVELADHPDHATEFNSKMLAHTQGDALREVGGVRLAEVFNRGPLVRSLLAAVAAIATIAAFAYFAAGPMGIWVQRNLLFSDIPWPRRVHLADLEGFKDKHIKIAKGSDLTIVAKADTRFEVPESLQIRYRTDEGRSREQMSRVGVAEPGDDFQAFSFVFRGILSSRSFDIIGGDAALRDYQIDVVDVPTIEMTLHCEYPPYTHRESRDLPVTGIVQLPQGTKITVHAQANKDLVEVPIHDLQSNQPIATIKLDGAADRRHFTFPIDHLDDDQTLLFTLVDADGIRSKEPVRLILNAAPDEPPKVAVHLRAISSAITPNARLPIEGEITDDYGLAKLWYEYKLDTAAPVQIPLKTDPRGRTGLKFEGGADDALDMKDRKLAVGQQMALSVMAQDNCTLKNGPNVAPGERYQLSVVTPDQLQSMLEARELNLRLRLEAIVQDLATTREQFAEVQYVAPKPPESAKPPAGKDKSPATSAAASQQINADAFLAADSDKKLAPGAEPEDVKSKGGDGTEPGDTGGSGHIVRAPAVVIDQTLANSQQSAAETVALATAFDDIREEMTNNRIDTPEVEYRLKDQIAEPLRRIAATMYPELDRRLRRLQAVMADPAAAKARHEDVLHQIDAILVEMRAVLAKMLELESFNEIVEHLRHIIDSHDKLIKTTQKRQKENTLKLND